MNVLYEDNHMIAVVKPVNVPSQGDDSGDDDMLTMVKEYLKNKYDKKGNVYAGLVQRLDRPVGGVMIFAKTSKAAARLSREISEGNAEKTYFAVLSGELRGSDKLEDYLLKGESGSTRVVGKEVSKAKYAALSYESLEVNDGMSLVKVELETGRHHQIRVQFASRGLPIVGDQRYGKRGNKIQIALWCVSLKIKHPVKDEVICVTCPPPAEFPFSRFQIEKALACL